MERIIFEQTVGDGYTYSCTNTYPMLYESKELAISDFELLMLVAQEKQIDVNAKIELLQGTLDTLRTKMQHQNARHPPKTGQLTLAASTLQLEFFKTLEQITALSNEIKDEFVFGGVSLRFSDFFDGVLGSPIRMPTFFTVDEFFETVESA